MTLKLRCILYCQEAIKSIRILSYVTDHDKQKHTHRLRSLQSKRETLELKELLFLQDKNGLFRHHKVED